MRGVYTVEQIRAAEATVIAALPEGALMQRAATALAIVCAQELRQRGHALYGSGVGLLVGSGNNGADALYAGANLARRGVAVTAVLLAPHRVHPGAFAEFLAAGGRVHRFADGYETLARLDLFLDGIVGIGGRGELTPEAAAVIDAIRGVPMVAVDIASGVDADTGVVAGAAVTAQVTVTFGGLKAGLICGAGVAQSGQVRLVDIGLELPTPDVEVLEEIDVQGAIGIPEQDDDKYTRGVVGVIAGSPSYPGAGVLATGAARRGGAGMIRYLGLAPDQIRARYPDVVVHADTSPRDVRVQAWVIGPGLGTGEDAHRLLRETLSANVAVLVDADAITLLAKDPSLLANRTAPTVLTPHDREFERIAGPVGADRLGAARRAARDLGVTMLLKGNATIVAEPSGHAYVNGTGTPWLATAGSGDVLSGLIGALLATGIEPGRAAAVGAYLHGLAGQLAAGLGNPDSQNVLDCLPRAIVAVGG